MSLVLAAAAAAADVGKLSDEKNVSASVEGEEDSRQGRAGEGQEEEEAREEDDDEDGKEEEAAKMFSS